MKDATPATPDSAHSWIERLVPAWFLPYSRIARLDRPIGWWLLLLPCWWGSALATASIGAVPNLWHMALFLIGAIAMRAAGCVFNDIIDRNIDAQVERTRLRPIPSGQISVMRAGIFMVALSLLGLAVLVQFNIFTIVLAIASLATVAIYPFMKRVTYWPQLFLGIAFNWGAMVGWSAIVGSLTLAPILLYLGGIAWTLGYDTVYGHQDRPDDELIGVRSTSRRFGATTAPWLWGFYGTALTLIATACLAADLHPIVYGGLLIAALHAANLIRHVDINDTASCLKFFRANRETGLIVFAALLSAGLIGNV
ncbi:MAG: 4-hydroxybenzoate octaprenyltransferase [Rhizobiales bacterium]|nr:4-hydroxybenzoate octaprenyltransferase [Hyphomicrobiales bacterium]